ncbi:hypothetical protein RDWZM_007615 [Blomia tropicalis]|uniref:Voltage-gated hydrogen channel 1 n=1 Tax=Blomia tropicalis TaxID=40697 RepID=A0A9Q0RI55_BLOTA|nr:hypothetical protein RDWZM_007615 [Blomia tropicalis]
MADSSKSNDSCLKKFEEHELLDNHLSSDLERDKESIISNNRCNSISEMRKKVAKILKSYQFHIFILILVVLDCLFVFGELILDLKLFEMECSRNVTINSTETESHKEHVYQMFAEGFHKCSLSILTFFVIEISLKLLVFGFTFFYDLEELIDAIIVIVSFVLDIIFFNSHLFKFFGLFIFLRLWRVVRIVHAIVTAVLTPMEHELELEQKRCAQIETKLQKALAEIESLKLQLASNESVPEQKTLTK